MYETDDRDIAYKYLGEKDNHILRLLHWMKVLQKLITEIAYSEQDQEMLEKFQEIHKGMTMELGIRISMIFL